MGVIGICNKCRSETLDYSCPACDAREIGKLEDKVRSLEQQLQQHHERMHSLLSSCHKHNYAVEQALGVALHYPRYCDDPVAFPNAIPSDGVCVDEHTAVTIAQEAAAKIHKLEAELVLLVETYHG